MQNYKKTLQSNLVFHEYILTFFFLPLNNFKPAALVSFIPLPNDPLTREEWEWQFTQYPYYKFPGRQHLAPQLVQPD